MLGHAPIVKMRLAGKRPIIVFINDFQTPEARDWHIPGVKYKEVWEPDHATIQVDAGDKIEALDLRFLTGLTVSATGSTEDRAKALFAACIAAGAKTVAAVHAIGLGTNNIESGWTEVYHAKQQQRESA